MAEFSRKSGRRVIENINTKKASKQEVFDFYKRQRAQLQRRGEKVDPLLKIKNVKKSDIVLQLAKMEKMELESSLGRRYLHTVKRIGVQTPSQAAKSILGFEKHIRELESKGKIDVKNILGGTLDLNFAPEPEPEPEPEPLPDLPDLEPEPPRADSKKQTIKYRGRLAHDLIANWVDDSLLDTDTFDDSEEIWEYMEATEEQAEDFNFFSDYYSGTYKKGTSKYYDSFKEFLQDKETFEKEMEKKKKAIPAYPSAEYWQQLDEWRKEQAAKNNLL